MADRPEGSDAYVRVALTPPADGACTCGADLIDETCDPDCVDPYMSTVRRVADAVKLIRRDEHIRDITMAKVAIDAIAATMDRLPEMKCRQHEKDLEKARASAGNAPTGEVDRADS